MPIVRNEYYDDLEQIRFVNEQAFGQTAEADLVDRLRDSEQVVLSLVAEADRKVVGHILFSPVSIKGADIRLAALGPMAVLPVHQRHGIGTLLVREGLEMVQSLGYQAVVVVGHPRFYHRFGFKPAGECGLTLSRRDVPPEAFMALELQPGGLENAHGTICYADEFDRLCNEHPAP